MEHATDARVTLRHFVAAYLSACATCGLDIVPGTLVAFERETNARHHATCAGIVSAIAAYRKARRENESA